MGMNSFPVWIGKTFYAQDDKKQDEKPRYDSKESVSKL